jgi:hypothetical protein
VDVDVVIGPYHSVHDAGMLLACVLEAGMLLFVHLAVKGMLSFFPSPLSVHSRQGRAIGFWSLYALAEGGSWAFARFALMIGGRFCLSQLMLALANGGRWAFACSGRFFVDGRGLFRNMFREENTF